MDRNDQSTNRSPEQGSQRDSMHGSDVDRGMSDRGQSDRSVSDRGQSDRSVSDRGLSGAGRSGGYGDDTGLSGAGLEGGNRNDPRTGTTANQTGSNRPSDVERMQGRPSEINDEERMEGGSVQRGSDDLSH